MRTYSGLWIHPGLLVVFGETLQAGGHQHHAIQVVWPSGSARTSVENEVVGGPVVMASGVRHTLEMTAGWLLLVEPRSSLGANLEDWLDKRRVKAFEAPIPPRPGREEQEKFPAESLSPLFEALSLDIGSGEEPFEFRGEIPDRRIWKLVERLNSCFGSECLKPGQWRAAEVAADLALSESRFLHLFREQMGIAWRPYLLWRRLLCAVMAMNRGETATAAAYQAGFSDAAHLSRTFSRMFGLSIRDATATFV